MMAVSLGNALEVYDFTVFNFFSPVIGKVFFPNTSPAQSLLMSLATLGAGLFARPLGALLSGWYADRYGRKAALTLTLGLMVAGTALIALVPSYAQIGLAAPLLLIAGRLIQGLSSGGEIGVASTWLFESAALRRRCFRASWQGASQGVAALAGVLMGASLTSMMDASSLEAFGWRIPFLLGLLVGPVGLLIRRQLHETLPAVADQLHVARLVTAHGRAIALGALMMTGSTASMYIMIFYMPTYIVTVLHQSHQLAFLLVCVSSAVLVVSAPLFGMLGDRTRCRKALPLASSLLGIAVVTTTFDALTHLARFELILALVVAVAACMSMCMGSGLALMLEGLPQRCRATGMSLMYSVGVAMFGGFAPFFVTLLIVHTGNPVAPVWYVSASDFISIIAILLYPRHRDASAVPDGLVPAGRHLR